MQVLGVITMVEVDEETADRIRDEDVDFDTLMGLVSLTSLDDNPAYYSAIVDTEEDDADARIRANGALLDHFSRMIAGDDEPTDSQTH